MKSILISLAFLITSTGQNCELLFANNDVLDASTVSKKELVIAPDAIQNSSNDSIIYKKFWEEIIGPILKRDRSKVLGSMDFPVMGHWTQMMKLSKSSEEATSEDFEKIYDKFFNDYFLKELAQMKYKNIQVYQKKDTTWYQFSINRILGSGDYAGEGSVIMIYYQSSHGFKLKNIQGAGGNFYYDLKL